MTWNFEFVTIVTNSKLILLLKLILNLSYLGSLLLGSGASVWYFTYLFGMCQISANNWVNPITAMNDYESVLNSSLFLPYTTYPSSTCWGYRKKDVAGEQENKLFRGQYVNNNTCKRTI